MQIKIIEWSAQERKERGVLLKLIYLIIEYYQLFIYLYTIFSSVVRVL